MIQGSHAARTGILMLEHKGIEYELRAIPTGTQRLLRLLFPGGTVPALVMNGRKVQTNRAIARFLDEVQPDPPLLPRDPARRAAVEEAERWADEVFQMEARRLTLAGALDWPGKLAGCGDNGRLGPLLWKTRRARRIGVRLPILAFRVSRDAERRLLERLPGGLDRIDAWIEDGVLAGQELNAADYAIATSVALLTYRTDLAAAIEARPAGALAERVLPAPG